MKKVAFVVLSLGTVGLMVGLGAMLGGCGNKADDLAKLMEATGGSTSLQAMKVAVKQARQMRARANAIVRQTSNRYSIFAPRSPQSSCGDFYDDTGTCTFNCTDGTTTDGNSSLSASCSLANQTLTCGADTFHVSNGGFNFSISMVSYDMTISMNMNADVSGGDLDGKVECAFSESFNINNPPASDSEVISCNNFSCKYKGDDIGCDDLKEEFKGC